MSKIVRIPEDHLFLVCSPRKAVWLKNAGAVAQPDLHVVAHSDFDWDKDEMMNSDRAGRRFDGGAAAAAGGARSAMELPDLEARHAEESAEKIVEMLADRLQHSPFGGLHIVAPPAFLGVLRQKLTAELRSKVVGEVAKDLVEMPVPEIQNSLLKAM